jgi:hypothetical protein
MHPVQFIIHTNKYIYINNILYIISIVYVLLGISPASYCCLPTFRNPLSVPSSRLDVEYELHTLHPTFEDGSDRGFRNVGKPQSDAGEIPKRTYTMFKTWRRFEIKNIISS